MSAWCPRCGRKLAYMRVDLHGSCSEHGVVAADFDAPLVVVNQETDEVELDVLGKLVRVEEDVVVYRRDDDSEGAAPESSVTVESAAALGGEW